MRARRANPAADFVVAPVAGGEENLASAGSESHAHFSVEQGTVCTVRLVAEVIFQEVYAVFGKGLGVEIFMVKAARIVGAGACSGAGIHAELEPLAVDIVAYETLLAKEQEKEEIQQGLIKACNVIDLIIEILRGSRDQKMAKACLINGETEGIKFKSKASEAMAAQLCFTERQAAAILEMRLYKLIGLEIEALIKEHEETRAKIAEYSDILEHRSSMAKVIMKELKAFRKEYARDRRTELDNLEEAVVVKKELEVSDVVLLMDRFGYVKTVDTSTYDRNKDTADAENKLILKVKNIDKLCIFTNNGNMHLVKVLDLPYGKFRDKGTPIDNVSNYDSSKEDIVFIAPLMDVEKHKLIFGTKSAMIKLVDGAEFVVTRRTSQATKLMDDDELLFVDMLSENATMVMRSKKEMFLRIDCGTIPEKKKAAVGVRGMRLDREDELTDIYLLNDQEEKEVEVKGKQVALHRLHIANRDTKGVKK